MDAPLTSDEAAIFAEHEWLVWYWAKRLGKSRRCRVFDRDDLRQVGAEALLSAILKLRKNRRTDDLVGYFHQSIKHAMWAYSVENRRAVRIPNRILSAAKKSKQDSELSETLRSFVLNGARSVPVLPSDAPMRGLRGKHSRQWYENRDVAHGALVLAVHRLTGLERQIAGTLLSERLCISEGQYRARLVDLAKRFGLSRRALGNLELRLLKMAVTIAKGRPHGRRATTAGHEAAAYRAIRKAPDASRVVLAVVGAIDGAGALAAATIAAGRILAPPEARLPLADLAACLRLTRGEARRIEVELLDQAVRLMGLKGVAA